MQKDEITLSIEFNKTPLENEELDKLTDIGYYLEKGIIFKRDYQKAKKIYTKCAAFGNGTAMNNLGWLYQNGFGVKKDINKAESYYRLAATKGETTAMINLGNIYEYNEKGLEKIDWKTARAWYSRAALLGDNKGKFNYANCLHYGRGGTKDRDTAFFIYQQLAGVVPGAYFYLGLYYENGYVVHKDIEKAIDYYTIGIENENDGFCCIQLANIVSKGTKNMKPNMDVAIGLYLRGINYGDDLGYVNIGYLYETGKIKKQDKKKNLKMALKWYQLGAAAGEENARSMLEKHHKAVEKNLDYTIKDLIKELD